MAVAFDAVASATAAYSSNAAASPATWNHTNAANAMVLAWVTGNGGDPATWVASVNGITMAIIGAGPTNAARLYGLLVVAAGMHGVSVTHDNLGAVILGNSSSYTGCDSTTPYSDFTAGTSGSGTSPTVTVPSAVGQLIVDFLFSRADITGVNQTTTVRAQASHGGAGQAIGEKAGATTSTTMGWTVQASGDTNYDVGLALNPAASGTDHEALSCTPGAVTVSGQSATLRAHRVLSCSPGAIALTGQNAMLRAARKLQAQAGSVTLTGSTATLRATRQLVAQPGAVTITGVNATLTQNDAGLEALTCTPGTFAIAGQAATLRTHRELVAQPGAVALAGQAATLAIGRALLATPGAITLSGVAATLRAHRLLTAQPGAVTITGQNATLTYSEFVAGTPGPHPLSVEFTAISRTVEFTAITRTVEFTPITRTVEFTNG